MVLKWVMLAEQRRAGDVKARLVFMDTNRKYLETNVCMEAKAGAHFFPNGSDEPKRNK